MQSQIASQNVLLVYSLGFTKTNLSSSIVFFMVCNPSIVKQYFFLQFCNHHMRPCACVETSNEQKHSKSTYLKCSFTFNRLLHQKYVQVLTSKMLKLLHQIQFLNQYNKRHFFEQKCYYHKMLSSLNSFDLKINKPTNH